jgi:epoxide hydrolase
MQAYRQMAAQGVGHGEAPPGPPQAVAVFAADTTIRSVMDPGGAIDRWTEYDRGGHFPALEVPDLLAADLREFFAAYREYRRS